VVKSGLRILLNRTGNKSKNYVRQYAWLLLSVARHHCKLSPEDLKVLQALLQRLGRREKGLRQKNRDKLAQFDNRENHRKLLDFPFAEAERGLKTCNPRRRAKYFDRAAASGILIFACLRMQNLSCLRIDQNIRWSGRKCFITFEDTEMKNDHRHEVEVGEKLSALLETYISVHRQHLPGSEGPYLFAGKNGGPRHRSALALEFVKSLRRHTGLRVNPHLMRHVMGKLMVEHDPALLPTVSRFLGHRSVQITMDYYLENDGRASSRVVNKVLQDLVQTGNLAKK
jgi:integrase